MRVVCECDDRKEYNDLIRQLRDENMNFSATEQKHITEWWDDDDPPDSPDIRKMTRCDFTVVFWYSGKLI